MSISGQIESVLEKIRAAEKKAGRLAGSVSLVAVSKTVEPARVLEAFQAGVKDFGENRVQELLEKKKDPALQGKDIRWHMIGGLQTNKVKQAVGEAVLIHSLDRIELAEEISRQAEKKGMPFVDCLIQVNSSGEATKQGLAPAEVFDFAQSIEGLRVRVRGLMTIGPLTEDTARIRACFREVRELREKLAKEFPRKDWGVLSMGMSGDYEIAIEEGSTLVRIGSAIFGARPRPQG